MNWVEETFQKMTLEQKVGQLIISRSNFKSSTLEMLRKGWLGGVGSLFIRFVCGSDANKIVKLTNQIQEESLIPPFFYTDCENGLPHVFTIGTEFPNNMAVAATGDPELAYKMGRAIANEARTLGYDIIAGPVLDINSNPQNPIIGTRAFADTVEVVTEFGKRYVDGVQEEQVIACGKHFPGHGDTDTDSHISVPVVDKCLKTLKKKEFYPFKTLVDHGIQSIMTSHTYFPELQQGEEVPVTFSEKAVKKLLLDSWKFKGLVVTDSLSMQAIAANYSVEEAAVLSIKAGNDMVLQDYNTDPMVTFNGLMEAVSSGRLTEKEIDEKVRKILKAKQWCGIRNKKPMEEKDIEGLNRNKFHQMLSAEIAEKSVTVLENRAMPIPAKQEILIISTRNDEGVECVSDLGTVISPRSMALYEYVKEYNENTAITTISENPEEEEKLRILELSKKFKHVIITNYIRIISYKQGSGTIPDSQIDFIERLAKQNRSVTNLIFGNPYVIARLPKTANILTAYSDCNASIKATVDILFGTKKSCGKLPVKLSRKYDRGYGL
ncbi:glycoside hydrolase family 3 protein [Acetivibrio sp. MSJd-27]|uniref:glycoside hydrolase family 3 protein n=1 Tax=Acetivibrio sp. MSJd-27 TaxID=2841523 RepID=UPI001C121A5E|nr:glycoside hydrolase family 3 protein [Acetivibrio sp. MSJd-27]MBU5451110.1 glycoside hydrolase family 3 protein [Acetivibrio sp. MSJd-27]